MRRSPTLFESLAVAEEVAREAAETILVMRDRARANARDKGDGQGPVTDADLAADQLIRVRLAEVYPHDLVVSEEAWPISDKVPRTRRVWFVDPLDGTREFIKGGDDYSVMVGLSIDGLPSVGVVLQPATGILWAGIVDTGMCVRINRAGEKTELNLRQRPLPDGPVKVAVSRSAMGPLTQHLASEIGATPVARGSVGLKVGMVVDGEADAYLSGSKRLKMWDTCAPAAIVMAAGGTLTRIDGRQLEYRGLPNHGGGARSFTPASEEALATKLDDALHAYLQARSTPKP